MIKELEAGTTLICDRYAFSGIAFSAAKSLSSSTSTNEGPTPTPSGSATTFPASTTILTYEWCRAPDISLPAPDLVLFLDVTPEIQAARGGYGEERYEKADLQRRVREVFRRIAGEFQTPKSIESSIVRWQEIDAGRSKQDVSNDIWAAVQPFVEKGGVGRPIGRLWGDVLH